ncbi:MAG: hypothetical protein EBQ58_12800 [Betaproteobacteria bacterium]|nr:hypothetical protein [Betaproteobacteria bacterium]
MFLRSTHSLIRTNPSNSWWVIRRAGSGDFVTRTVGEAIAAELGQSAVIDNRPGAAGNLASELVNKSPADGYTLLVASNPYINKALYKKLNYDIEKDF